MSHSADTRSATADAPKNNNAGAAPITAAVSARRPPAPPPPVPRRPKKKIPQAAKNGKPNKTPSRLQNFAAKSALFCPVPRVSATARRNSAKDISRGRTVKADNAAGSKRVSQVIESKRRRATCSAPITVSRTSRNIHSPFACAALSAVSAARNSEPSARYTATSESRSPFSPTTPMRT